jgi:CRP-like cAMP-binding protein
MNNELFKKLKELPVFKYFEKKDIMKILKYSTINNYKTGDIIINEGSFDDRVYFLVSGKLAVEKHNEQISMIQRMGDIFGEMCIIDGTARSASVKAVESATCMVTDISFLDSMNPDDKVAFSAVFYHILAEVLAQRLRQTSQEVVQLKEELAALKGNKQ